MADVGQRAQGRIETARRGGEFHIRIANPERYNAMSLSMWEALARAVADADADADMRVVVLSGSGSRAFASGADISEFATQRSDPEQRARYGAAVAAAQRALAASCHPTVAVIRGVCMGGGMALAIACDLRYCTEDARFRMPAGRLGLGYALEGMQRFASVLGPARAADLFLTARSFDGREAARIGLVQEAFGHDSFEAVTRKRIEAIAALAPLTLRAARLALRHIADAPGAPEEAAVQAAIRACFESRDYAEGQQAFLDKREPRFRGT